MTLSKMLKTQHKSVCQNFDLRKDHSYSGFFCSQLFLYRPHSTRFYATKFKIRHTHIYRWHSHQNFSIYTNGNWQWCKREVGLFRHVASCEEPNDLSGWSSARIGDTWMVWPPCVCDNGGSVRPILRSATRILPKNICMVFPLKQKEKRFSIIQSVIYLYKRFNFLVMKINQNNSTNNVI